MRDVEVIQAALLHDTVEDTDTSFDEIEAEFGVNVCQLVREVTDDKHLPKAERKRLQVIYFLLFTSTDMMTGEVLDGLVMHTISLAGVLTRTRTCRSAVIT